jgi:hypothetical protein
MQAHSRGVDPAVAPRKISHPSPRPATHRRRIKKHQISLLASNDPTSISDSTDISRSAGHCLYSLLQRQIFPVPYPVTQKVQSKSRVTKKRQMGTRV